MRKHFTVRSNRNSQPINTGILLPFMSGGIILTSFSSNHAARTNKSCGKSDLAKTKPRLLLFNAAFLFQRAIFHLCEYLFKVVLDELALHGGAGSIYGRPDFVRGLQNCCGWPRHDWSLRLSKIPHPGIAYWFCRGRCASSLACWCRCHIRPSTGSSSVIAPIWEWAKDGEQHSHCLIMAQIMGSARRP